MRSLEKIAFANSKILAISHFATKANFNSSSERINADIITYIEQYIESVKGFFNTITIHFANKKQIELKKTFRPIEISVMLDNFFNNSMKARAKNIHIEIDKSSNSEVIILISDDGNGIAKEIKNPQDVFEKGYTTTKGSGLGLYHVFLIVVNELKGSIAVNDNTKRGFQLKVVLKDEPKL
jgi:sensor histidine kinase regulating citrate/malate metabolism